MASKKLKKQIDALLRKDASIQQQALDVDLKRKAFRANARRAEDRAKYEAGGQVKKTRLWKLDIETRQGALYLAGDWSEDPAFLDTSRARSTVEGTDGAKSGADAWRMYAEAPKAAAVATTADTAKAAIKGKGGAGPTLSEPQKPEQLTVRFRSRIPPGHGLRPLGLHYDRDKQEWNGLAVRAAVELEISHFRHLLISIEVQTPPSTEQKGGDSASGEGRSRAQSVESWELPADFTVELES
jgi:hypothetical protein